MASNRFIVLDSYQFWKNRLLLIWCALSDKQKYHQNQQIASLIVHFFFVCLKSGKSSVLEVLGSALCSIRTLQYAVPMWKNYAICTWSCFSSKDRGFALQMGPCHLVSSVGNSVHLQDDWMRLDI